MSAIVTAAPLTDATMLVLLDELERNGALTPTALTLDHELDYDTYDALGRFLGRLSSANKWWLGDWLVYGERVYPGDAWAQAAHETGRSIGTLRNYRWVAERVAPQRRLDLSWSHHAEVAALPARQQTSWLRKALRGDGRESWAVEELRARIRLAAQEADSDGDGAQQVLPTSGKPARRDEVRSAATAVWHQAVKNGDSYHVPVDVMARLGSALGYH